MLKIARWATGVWAVVMVAFASMFTTTKNPVVELGLSIRVVHVRGAARCVPAGAAGPARGRGPPRAIAFVATLLGTGWAAVGLRIGGKALAFPWFVPLGVLITLTVGSLVALVRPSDPPAEDHLEPPTEPDRRHPTLTDPANEASGGRGWHTGCGVGQCWVTPVGPRSAGSRWSSAGGSLGRTSATRLPTVSVISTPSGNEPGERERLAADPQAHRGPARAQQRRHERDAAATPPARRTSSPQQERTEQRPVRVRRDGQPELHHRVLRGR